MFLTVWNLFCLYYVIHTSLLNTELSPHCTSECLYQARKVSDHVYVLHVLILTLASSILRLHFGTVSDRVEFFYFFLFYRYFSPNTELSAHCKSDCFFLFYTYFSPNMELSPHCTSDCFFTFYILLSQYRVISPMYIRFSVSYKTVV